MATRVFVGYVSELVADRLSNLGLTLEPAAIEYLNHRQDAFLEQGNESAEPGMMPRLDDFVNQLAEQGRNNGGQVESQHVRSVLGFFCPGFVPFC